MRSRRPPHNTLDRPVVLHAGTREHASQEQVMQFLGRFIKEREEEADAEASGALAQLRRVERDFKGLPPAVLDTE
ncbi:LANO_0H05072g1_1 [Lachancea nothofagi CBS 11611]|uniref:LANO_0H05072g1_1 n=1 Tax=Lachancea nothofagi CBS 11611 TaxID=1266666 RepID=A0A1G4KLA7_9SACH|nr:LANO_0H05072g1_1 [Lachancea nothofagi CBS 11611]